MSVEYRTLFLTLNSFSGNGGLEKFNQAFSKAFGNIKNSSLFSQSVYDVKNEKDNYKGYGGSKFRFIKDAVFRAKSQKEIIIGHLNLAPIAVLLQFLYPSKKYYLIIHGLEIWLPVNRVKRYFIKKADRFIVVSRHTKTSLQEQFGIPQEWISILNNTIDPNFNLPEAFYKPEDVIKDFPDLEDSFVLLTVCRMKSSEGYKGYDKVIRALPEIKKYIPNVKYLLVGKFDAVEKQRLDSLVSADIKESIHFTGFVTDIQLENFFRFADLFVMPSTHEGFGIVYIESMAYGTPVLAGNIDGSTDALADGELGFLINPHSHEELVDMVCEIHRDYSNVLKGKALQKKVLERFSFEKFQERVTEIFSNSQCVV